MITTNVVYLLTYFGLRGVIKSSRPGLVLKKIKIVFASYSRKAQNSTCPIWLMGCKYFVHFSGHRLFAFDMEKDGVTQCNEMTILIDSFVPLHALLFGNPCCSDSESKWWIHVSSWITSCKKNLLGHIGIIREVLQKLVYSLVLAFSTPSDRRFVHALKSTKYL